MDILDNQRAMRRKCRLDGRKVRRTRDTEEGEVAHDIQRTGIGGG